MSEYLERQNEEAACQQRIHEEEQRKIWTPPSILEQCCLQWLSHGPYQMIRNGSSMVSVTSRGCSGCSKAHPKITLGFNDDDTGVATASVSHALDPFAHFFENLQESSQENALEYRLNGLLSNHYERIKQKFGAHMVSVEHKALVASQRAYKRQLEQNDLEQAEKKRKVLGDAAPVNLLESVLEISYNHSLRDLLDIADIAWMRTSCKAMGRIAARMASHRMRAVKLSYTAFIPTCDSDLNGFEMCDPPFRPLSPRAISTDISVLCPGEPQKSIRWSYCKDDDPSDIRIEVYIDRERSAIPEKCTLFDGHSNHLEVAAYLIESRNFQKEGEIRDAQSNVQNCVNMEGSLKYRVNSCSLDDRFLGYTTSHGEMSLQSIAFTFNDFLGVYLRMRLHAAKQKYNSSKIKNPADKIYIKALAKAAREAPGNVDSFRSMVGWENVYGA